MEKKKDFESIIVITQTHQIFSSRLTELPKPLPDKEEKDARNKEKTTYTFVTIRQ